MEPYAINAEFAVLLRLQQEPASLADLVDTMDYTRNQIRRTLTSLRGAGLVVRDPQLGSRVMRLIDL